MPMNRKLYPADWEAISRRIRFERGRGQCECQDGLCGLSHGGERCQERHGQPAITFNGKVVLTTAHLNHDTSDNREENLAGLCNACHLRLDKEHHAANSRATRERRSGQMRLL